MDRDGDPFYRPRAHLKPQDWRELDGHALEFRPCGHVSEAYAPDGHPYGPADPGSWVTCFPCQCQREVVRCIRVPRVIPAS